jgi:hypothetical protein
MENVLLQKFVPYRLLVARKTNEADVIKIEIGLIFCLLAASSSSGVPGRVQLIKFTTARALK